MRISDWSSDVCSSDLHGVREGGSRCPCRTGAAMLNRRGFISGAIASSGLLPTLARAESRPTPSYPVLAGLTRGLMAERTLAGAAFAIGRHRHRADRSEERLVGTKCGRSCSYWGSPSP